MVVMVKGSNRWLALLGAAVIFSSVQVLSFDDGSSVSECVVDFFADGDCDDMNNNAACGYDSGDCCACTCESTDNFTCGDEGHGGYACIDPSAPCVDDDDVTAEMVQNCDVQSIGNGYCDMNNNNIECDYDGGDCCECTCDTAGTIDEYACSPMYGFACIDPSAPCVDDDSVTAEMVENCGSVKGIGNGYCDIGNNKVECDYDGGDCCECTCDTAGTTDEYACSRMYGFACIDPSAPCVDDDSVTVDMIENCGYAPGIGNGYCDNHNNKMECAFDGGDCCDCTCVPNEDDAYSCSQFACIDSSAPCVDDDIVTIDMLDNCGWVMGIGDGYCNDDNNKAECAYDGGDCCECTCEPDDEYQCREFACIDPEAACVDDDSITVDMFENCDYVLGIGDGFCDPYNNKIECGFDGGDCCSCTCDSIWDDDWRCSQNHGFECKDTSAPCFGEEITLYNNDDTDFGSYDFVPWVQEGALPTVEGAVEVGTQTEVSISATAHDVRPGAHVGEVGCGEVGGNGCEAANSHDGISSEIESRWSCASKLLDDEGPCIIEYTFGAPQDIVDIQVAFWKGDERIRTLDVHLDGVYTHTHESYSGSTFNTLGVSGTGVTTVALESIELQPDEWISLIEVLIFVTPSTGDEDQSMSYNFVTP